MIKKILVLSAMLGMMITTGCTSQNAKDESGDQVVTEGGELENVGGDAAAPADGLDASATGSADGELSADPALDAGADAGAQANTSDQLTEDALGEVPAAPNEVIADAPAATDPGATPPADNLSPTDTLSGTPPPALDTPPPLETSSGLTESVPPVASTEDKPKPSLKKIAPEPWKVGKTLFNTVYFARPGDSLSKISQKIYGDESRVKELKKGNPTLANDVKPGSKVYYNSPNRPDDSTKVITFFEDNGIPPKTYIAKKGDNIRSVSKELLGYKNAWQEVWASNAVESKAELDEGTELKYWSEEPMAAVAKTEAPSTEIPPAPPADGAMNNAAGDPNMVPPAPPIEPPPPPDMAQQPPPPPDMAMQPPPPPPEAVAPPPPPPPDVAMAPPPPPPPAAQPQNDALAGSPLEGMDQDTMMIIGLVGVGLILMVSMFIRNKKRRQREFEQAMNETQVGT